MGTIGTVQALFEADTRSFDASLKGASASLGQVGEQAGIAGQKVDAATRLQEAAARRVQRVLAQVAAEQKSLAGQEVTAGARKVPEATLAQSRAYTELHRVQGLVRSGNVEEATSVDLLAAAQSRAAEASATLAEAKQREGAAAELAGVREALAGQKVTEESLRTTAALREQAEAQALLSRAQGLAASGAVAGPEGISLIAAAQMKQVEAAAAVAAAKKAEAAAVAQAAEEEVLSQNAVIRAFQRMAIAVREALTSVQEKLVETAETAGLEADGISASFAGLGKLLGAGLAVTFAAHFADDLAKSNLELDHLKEKTGVSIEALAGLRQEFRQLGADPDSSNKALTKMDNAFEKAKSGDKAALGAFGKLGIKPEELRSIGTATELLARLSRGMAETEAQEKRTSAATAIFGKGGADMIPVLLALGGNFDAATAKLAAMTGVTQESIEASKRWIANSATMQTVLQRLGNFAIENFHYVAAVLDGVGTVLQVVFEGVATLIVGVVKEIAAAGLTLYDAMHMNFGKLPGDVENVKTAFVDVWKAGFKDISHNWDESIKLWKPAPPPKKEPPAPFGKSDDDDFTLKGPRSHAAQDAAQAQMEAFEHGAAVLEEQGNADAFTIHGYWAKKIEAMQKGSAEYSKLAGNLNYDKIYAQLAAATKRMDAELEKSLHPKKDESGAAFEREQERYADAQARRVAEIRQQAADAQAKLQEKAQLSDVSIALSHGEISRYQALVAEAQIHAASFGAEIAEVEKRLADAEAMRNLPGMDQEIARRQAQLAQLHAQADEQAQLDASAISSQTMGGAFHDALNEWVQQSNDAAALVRKTFTEAATGINDDLAKALTDPARTSYERMQNLRNGLAGTARGIANQGITFGLGKLESTLPGELGKLFGGGKKPSGAKGDPLYIAFDSAAAGAAGGGLGAMLRGIVPSSATNPAAGGGADFSSFFSSIYSGASSHATLAAPASGIARTVPTLLRRGFGSSDTSSSGGGSGGGSDIFSSIFSGLGGSMGSAAGGDSSGGGGDSGSGGDIFSSIFSGLGGSMGGGSAAPGDADSLSTGAPAPQQPPLVTVTRPKQGGIGNLVSGLVSTGLKLIPGFEGGGPIAPDMGPFIAGEAGPEIVDLGSHGGHVTSSVNSKLRPMGSGGGDTHHHWAPGAIDARGSTSPAETDAAVQRGILKAAPMIAKMGMQGTREQGLRRPSSAH